MKKSSFTLLSALLLILACSLPAAAEMVTCAQCGMMSDLGSKFTARITGGEKPLYFCDIGDLLTYLNAKKPQAGKAEVKDYMSGDWLDAREAFYVHAEKTFKSPMGWGLASFKNKSDAAAHGTAMDFDNALKAVK